MLPNQLGEIRFVHNPYSFQGEMHLWVPFKPESNAAKEKDTIRPQKTYPKPQPTVPPESPAPAFQSNHLHPCAASFNPPCPPPQWQPQPQTQTQTQTSNCVAFAPQAPMPTQSAMSHEEAARLVLLQTAASLIHHQELAPAPQPPNQHQQPQARSTQKEHTGSSSQTNTTTTTVSPHNPGHEPQPPATPAPDAATTTKRVLNRKNAKKKDLAPDPLEPKNPSKNEKMIGAGAEKKPLKVAEQAGEGEVEPPSSPTLQTLFAISKSSGMCCSHDPRRWKCLRVKLGVQHMICLECENRWRVPKSLLQSEGGQTSKKQSEASGSVKV